MSHVARHPRARPRLAAAGPTRSGRRSARVAAGAVVLVIAVGYLATAARASQVPAVALATLGDPVVLGALACYAAAFWLRAAAWRRMLPALPVGQAWAALHVGLLGNHLLPMRLGEAMRPASVVRRTRVGLGAAAASTLTMRGLDLLAVLLLAVLAAPALVLDLAGAVPAALTGLALLAAMAAGVVWCRHLDEVHRPDAAALLLPVLAWVLEATVVWSVARAADVPLAPLGAVAVTAVTMAAQTVAVTPGGIGSYEAAATAALTGLGAPPGPAFAVALATHALKTGYALLAGAAALVVPAPSWSGRLRLPRCRAARPGPVATAPDAPVVVVLPAFDEQATISDVVRRVPARCCRRPVRVVVVDDGSRDATARLARRAGALVVRHDTNQGLGAAVRRGLAEACALAPAAVVFLDADAEYSPDEVERLAGPVLDGAADYVVGSRFTGRIDRMLLRRRIGNRALTGWLRWVSRCRSITDGQSGFRALSAAAAADAEIAHDYNYAQVLTLDLLAKGYRYGEVPISYCFRVSGRSFVRPGRYLRRVVPAVQRALNTAQPAQSSTTWAANRARAAAQAAASNVPPGPSAATASAAIVSA